MVKAESHPLSSVMAFILTEGSTMNLMEILRCHFLYCSCQLPKSQLENWLTKVDKVVTEVGFEGCFIEQ